MTRDDHADTEQSQQLIVELMRLYANDASAMAWSGGLVALMGELGVSQPAARMALSRLVRRGVLARAKQGRYVHHLLDDRVRDELAARDARIAGLVDERPVAEAWTLVWHHAAVDARQERGRFGRRLRSMGFGSLQPNVWIAPYDVQREVAGVAAELELDRTVSFVVAPASGELAPRPERIWDLAGLNDRYRAYCAAFEHLAASGAVPDGPQAFVAHVHADSAFRAIAGDDPGLPLSMTGGEPELRAAAFAVARSVDDVLRPAAQHHFDATTTAWMGPGVGADRPATGKHLSPTQSL